MTTASSAGWDAIVVAGGASRRMGDDKLDLEVAGRSLLHCALDAVAAATRRVVVGPHRDVSVPVTWCREQPEGSGPAAAVRAGLEHVTEDLVVVLAADQPFVDEEVVAALLDAVGAGGVDGAVAVDADEQPQWLCSAWRVAALRGAPLVTDGSLRRALSSLRWRPVAVDARAALDCDTPEDLRRARELAR
jgi:molybdopterin-guanine dinucleotide biosynthesis protein A